MLAVRVWEPEETAAEVLVGLGPVPLSAGVVAGLAGEGVGLGVEVVEVVQRHGIGRHRTAWGQPEL